LTPERIDQDTGAIVFDTLKRRKRGIVRAIPMPETLFYLLDEVHNFRRAQRNPNEPRKNLWVWSRAKAWRRVKQIMRNAQIPIQLSNQRSLRQAFGLKPP